MSVHVSSLVWRHGPTAPADRLMLLALADNADDYGLAWPGVQRLADKCCVTVRSAQRTLRRLEAEGWLTTHVGGGTRGARDVGIPSRYQVNMGRLSDPDVNATVEDPKGDVDAPNHDVGVAKGDVDDAPKVAPTSGEPSLEPSTEPSGETSLAVPDPFDDFWTVYPRKVGKGQARKAWAVARRKLPTLEIVTAALAFAEWCKADGTDPKFIPHPATWLNGERWSDERPAARTSNVQNHLALVQELWENENGPNLPELEG